MGKSVSSWQLMIPSIKQSPHLQNLPDMWHVHQQIQLKTCNALPCAES